MVDLSPWDFDEEFTAYEAAALIKGVEPLAIEVQRDIGHKYHAERALKPLEDAYALACMDCSNPAGLRSLRLLELTDSPALSEWLKSDLAKPERQCFSRDEIGRWLTATGRPSLYQFRRRAVEKADPKRAAESDRALSTRERNTLLSIIAVLCKEAKLDYSKASKTAGFIQSSAALMGVSIGESTIEGHLKKIPDALESRSQ